ncbi:aminoglycoside adenylyltransferase domain-containing protein [Shinella sp. S4-D37]|uniref:aminoglycoside adenylyltransferase domain-containing protein n=1 Tax=Shinella sp. S4-D37 TaxID=3161999 RepID=UPI00346681B9
MTDTQARQEAVALVGPDREALLPAIPTLEVRNAMGELLSELLRDLREDTRHVLLTLARIWHTAENGVFVSKDEAANWAIPNCATEAP